MAFYLQLTIIWLITWAAQHVPGFVGSQNSILQNPGVLLLRCHVHLVLQSSPGKNNYSPNRALVSFSRVQTGANIDRQHHCQKNAIGYTVLNQKKRIILSWFTRTSNVSYFTCCSCHKTSRDCQAPKTKKTIKCQNAVPSKQSIQLVHYISCLLKPYDEFCVMNKPKYRHASYR